MKSKLYYSLPFIIVFSSMWLFELLDDMQIIEMSPYVLGSWLVILSAVFGFFSHSEKSFDYLMTAIMPISLFFVMLTAGFLAEDDMGVRFNFDKAVDADVQPIALLFYVLMAVVTFWASFKKLRKLKAF